MSKPMKHLSTLTLALAASIAIAAPASAAAAADSKPTTPCFFTSQWDGWTAPDDKTILIGLKNHDVYRIEVTGGANFLRDPGAYLVTTSHTTSVCSHMDLDLKAGNRGGFATPLIARSMTRLTKAEVAALPKKDRPN